MSILEYLFRSSLVLFIFMIIYQLLLKQKASHHHSRVFILLAFIISIVSPALQFTSSESISEVPGYIINEVIVSNKTVANTAANEIQGSTLILFYYLIISAFFAVRMLIGLVKIFYIRHTHSHFKEGSHEIILLNKEMPVFSFFNKIFIHNTLIHTEVHEHEIEHTRLMHSIDRLFISIAGILFWINPAYWILKKELERVHEYQADRAVLEKGIERTKYQKILLSLSMGYPTALPVNQFNKSFIKNRIMMMNTKKQFSNRRWLLTLPLALATVWIMACSHSPAKNDQTTTDEQQPVQTEKVYDEVDKMPEFPGGQEAMGQFFVDNVKYPKKAKEEGIQGKVFVNFIVDKDGKVKDVSIKQSVNPELDAEAMRVVKMMPNWTPGEKDGKAVAVEITLPVNFVLSDEK